jgi:endonuclease III related protein
VKASSARKVLPWPTRPKPGLRTLYNALYASYGQQCWWPADTPLEVAVGAYLTQNTSWLAVERSIANLKARGAMTLEGLRAIPEDELRMLIRPSGHMTRKAAAIKAFVAFLDREHAGSMERLAAVPTPMARRQLLALPGVGNETADAILLYALDHPVMVADEYLRRIAWRHSLAPEGAKYAQLQELAASAFAGEELDTYTSLAKEFHALVVAVGKDHCRNQPICHGCPLERFLDQEEEKSPAVPAVRRNGGGCTAIPWKSITN